MALAQSRRPSMAGFRGVRRESRRVIRSAANTAMSQARTSGNMSLATQVRKLSSIHSVTCLALCIINVIS
ncbi:MAG: hypothetical protein U9P07_00445 [Pseudomonadota bacterium]|nr:hypothetical protein [Pseudomonadota bacterium]